MPSKQFSPPSSSLDPYTVNENLHGRAGVRERRDDGKKFYSEYAAATATAARNRLENKWQWSGAVKWTPCV